MRAHSFPIQKEAAKTSMLMLHRHLEFDSCLRLAHRILKIGKGSSLPMDPMARRPPKRNLLPVLRVCNEGGRRSNKTTWISRFEYTDLPCPSQQASVYQNLSFDPDLSRSPQHRRPKWPFSFHTRFGCKKIPQEKGGGNDKKRAFLSKCTKSPDNIQQKCTCTDHKRAGTKVPSTSAHSLYTEWQNCFLIFAKHATS